MRIMHNIMALNTYRKLNSNGKKASESIEKLSSGFKINRAGDDAAGLSISEKMRAQIRGLNQADLNAQDAISLVKTAEGALDETHSILQRMRELSVQASNDVNSNIDRQAIQDEINQLTQEIDRIGDETEFNTKKLLNKTTASVPLAEEELMMSNLKKWWLDEAETLVKNSYGIATSGIAMDVEVYNDSMSPFSAYVAASYKYVSGDNVGKLNITGQGSNLLLRINLAYAQPVTGPNGGTYPQYVDRVIAHEITHAVMSTTMNFGDLPTWFIEGTAEFVHGADERLKGSIFTMGGGSLNPANLDAGVAAVVNKMGTGSEGDWGSTSNDYSAAYLAVRYLDHQIKAGGGGNAGNANPNGIKLVTQYLAANPTKNLDEALLKLKQDGFIGFDSTAAWATAFKTDVKDVATLASMAGVQLDFSVTGSQFTPEIDTGSVLGSDVTGNLGDKKDAESVLPETAGPGAPEVQQPMEGFTLTYITHGTTLVSDSFTIQIGANAGQTMVIQTKDMRAEALGIKEFGQGLSVMSHNSANAAITRYDMAIESVSAQRSKFGAYQNRLEHASKNLETSSENLSASESRIRDVDMAKEMMEFTKQNILQQAAQAMLAQANQQPQGILQLLA